MFIKKKRPLYKMDGLKCQNKFDLELVSIIILNSCILSSILILFK